MEVPSSEGFIPPPPLQPPIAFIVRKDANDVLGLFKEYEALNHAGCCAFQLGIENMIIGKWLRATDRFEINMAFVQVLVRRREAFLQ